MNKRIKRIFLGIALIIAAGILIADKLGYMDDVNVVSLLITVCMIYIILESIYPINFGGILLPLAIIGIVYDDELGITEITPWVIIIVAILLSAGLDLIFKSSSGDKNNKSKCNAASKEFSDKKNSDTSNNTNSTFSESKDDYVFHRTRFGATTKYINSDNFKGADFECSFGAMTIYFDKANIREGKAVVKLNTSFSGVELYIPKEWNVINNISASLSGVENKNANKPTGEVTLVLEGHANLCGIEIVYV